MSRMRHKAKANGGPVKGEWNAGGNSNAAKEAEEKATGGKVTVRAEGGAVKSNAGKRARGGQVTAKAAGGSVIMARARGGSVRGRAMGGGIGANLKPLSTAATIKKVTPGETDETGEDKVM